MAITNKVVTVPLLQHYKEKEDAAVQGKYVAQEAGKGLIETEKVTKLDGIETGAQVNKVEGIQINGTDLVPDGESKVVNITAKDLAPDLEGYVQDSELTEQLTPYLKSTDAESTYLKSETAETTYLKTTDAQGTYATKEEIGALGTIKGSCEKADLESKKEGAKENDVWIVTDDDNHLYFYNGTDFVDTQAKAHVDLSGYVAKDGDKVLVSPTDVTQITTNKTDIATINDTLGKLTEAEEADIDALFAEE